MICRENVEFNVISHPPSLIFEVHSSASAGNWLNLNVAARAYVDGKIIITYNMNDAEFLVCAFDSHSSSLTLK